MKRSSSSGFTLIELLLVVVIIGILAALVIPRLVGRSEEARIAAAQTDLKTISMQLVNFEMDNTYYPSTDEGLDSLLVKPSGHGDMPKWRKYLDRNSMPRDPWGNEYVYSYPNEDTPPGFDLYSKGPDGQEGTKDDVQRPGYEKEDK